ncbi:MAG: 1-deoxy-D-xylulose-5-phosphate reductoisomerase, partial [Martelella sp.]
MRTAIGYALAYPERRPLSVERLDFAKLARLDFEAPDETRFPALRLARLAMARGGLQGAVLNAAKEVALEAFIEGRCGFLEMAEITEGVMDALDELPAAAGIGDIYAADGEARRKASGLLNS